MTQDQTTTDTAALSHLWLTSTATFWRDPATGRVFDLQPDEEYPELPADAVHLVPEGDNAELAAKDAEIERLHDEAANALVNQATLKDMSVKEGAAVLELGSPCELVIVWVDAARKMLGNAENYSETRIDFPAVSMEIKAAGETERYVFTVQRAGKLTPHEARKTAEAERDEARAQLAELRKMCPEICSRQSSGSTMANAEIERLRAEIDEHVRVRTEIGDILDTALGGYEDGTESGGGNIVRDVRMLASQLKEARRGNR